MLKCRDVAHKASDYLDGNQTLGQRLAVAFHLLMCGHCRAFIHHLRTTLAYFNKYPHQQLGEKETAEITKRATSRV